MAVAWPISLQDCVNEDNFGNEKLVLRTDMDCQLQKIYKALIAFHLSTSRGTPYSKPFYNTSLNGRVLFIHPVLTEFRFVGVPG